MEQDIEETSWRLGEWSAQALSLYVWQDIFLDGLIDIDTLVAQRHTGECSLKDAHSELDLLRGDRVKRVECSSYHRRVAEFDTDGKRKKIDPSCGEQKIECSDVFEKGARGNELQIVWGNGEGKIAANLNIEELLIAGLQLVGGLA